MSENDDFGGDRLNMRFDDSYGDEEDVDDGSSMEDLAGRIQNDDESSNDDDDDSIEEPATKKQKVSE